MKKRLLIIVEGLDKVSISEARNLFVENNNLLTGLKTNIIYTIPIFAFYSPDAGLIKAAFDFNISLPMIKVSNPDGTRAEEGFAIMRQIVHKRVASSAIDADALDHLIQKTGGVLRHVFEVIQSAASMTSLYDIPIRMEHVKYGLNHLKTDLGIQIALPDDSTIENVKQLYDKLREYIKRRTENLPCPPTADPIVQVLLKCCALVEYNGTRWLGVHPLVVEYLEELDHTI